jgi:hypothetical protein
MEKNICKGCKHNAPGSTETLMVKINGQEMPWAGMGDECQLTRCFMSDVEECSGFEKIEEVEQPEFMKAKSVHIVMENGEVIDLDSIEVSQPNTFTWIIKSTENGE